MSEEKQSMEDPKAEKKRLGKTRRVLKWFALSLLAVLTVLALVFQAPWKVTALLVIFLLACTILPKPCRKWFLLSSAVVLIALLIWLFLPDADDTWSPYILEEEIATFEAGYAIPEEENAATIYNKFIQNHISREWRLRFLHWPEYCKTSSEPWLSRDHPELIEWIRENETKITALPRACQMKKCRFRSAFKISTTDKLIIDRYAALKSWAILFLLSGNNDLAEGRPNDAFAKYIYALQIKEHLYQQKRTVDFLIGFGIEGLILPAINRFVIENEPTEKQLRLILETLGNLENNWCRDFSQCLEYDKLFVKNTFCSLAYQTNSKGRVRFSRYPAAAIWRRRTTSAETFWQKKSMKAYAISAWFFFPPNPQKASEMIDSILEQFTPMASADFNWNEKNAGSNSDPSLKPNCRSLINFLTNKSTCLYGGFHNIYLKHLSQRRGLTLLIAIKQYNAETGRWPTDLDEIKNSVPSVALIDPLNNSPFVYKTTEDTFTLYSKGKNNIDENGRSLTDAGLDDLLTWPSERRKTE